MNILLATTPNFNNSLKTVYDVVGIIMPIVLTVIFIVGMFKCISLGIAYAKTDENGSHAQAKKDLTNAIIGFVLIFVLMLALYLLRTPIINWVSGIAGDWNFID